MDGLEEIVGEFLAESREDLDQVDRDLVALERGGPGATELLGGVFRTLHTIKGSSGFLGLERLGALAHAGEGLLAALRDGHAALVPGVTDVLLELVDAVRALLAQVELDGTEGDVDPAPVVARIGEALAAATAAAAPVPVPAGHSARTPPVPGVPQGHSARTPPVPGVPQGHSARTPPVPSVAAPVAAPAPATAEASVRVDVPVLDDLVRLTGELVLARNRILAEVAALGAATGPGGASAVPPGLARACARLNTIAGELQEGVMKTRMQPVEALWSKVPRLVRDLGAQCGRAVRLELAGGHTELDRTLLEAVKDPLLHLVRNAVDHGVEAPERRTAAGKDPEGLLVLRARHESGQVVIEVSDDGAGMDPARIGAVAVERGALTAQALERMGPAEVLQLIFAPGFSTASAVTAVSGRGVGMDVVRTDVEAIGGTIEVESTVGVGTTCRLRLPLTLAIVPALVVECAGDRYAVPQVGVQELVALGAVGGPAGGPASGVEDVAGVPVHRLRGELLPLVHLADVLGTGTGTAAGGSVVAVLRSEGRRFGVVVDRVVAAEEIVVKAVDERLRAVGMYSGATILGDGTVSLILDVQGLARRCLRPDLVERREPAPAPAAAADADAERLLLARAGAGRRVGVPLAAVTRLERVPASAVRAVGAGEVLQHRGQLLPVVRLDRHLAPAGAAAAAPVVPSAPGALLDVVVHARGGRAVAVVVEEILDVVDARGASSSDVAGPGVLGAVAVGDQVVELLDVEAAVLAADPSFPLGAAL